MVEIKKRISFDEFYSVVNKVVGDCFTDGTYSPAYYELSFRVAMLNAYCPEFEIDMTDNNTIYECVESEEAWELFNEIKRRKQYYDIETAIRNGINFQKDLIIHQHTSMTDMVLAETLELLNQKIKDGQNIDTETVNKFMDKINRLDDVSEEAIVKALADLQVLDKE